MEEDVGIVGESIVDVIDEPEQYEIDAQKADDSIFGFHTNAHAALIHGKENHKGHVSGVIGTKTPYDLSTKEEAKAKKFQHDLNMLTDYGIPKKAAHIIGKIAEKNKEIKKAKTEKKKILDKYDGKKENIFKRQAEIARQAAFIESCTLDMLCTIEINKDLIDQNLKQVEDLKQQLFEKFPEEGAIYERHRELAKLTVAVDIKLNGDDPHRAHPIVFMDEKQNRYFVKDQSGNTHYLDEQPDWETHKESIERQLSRGGKLGNDLSEDIIEEWENTSGSQNELRLMLDYLDDNRKAWKNDIYTLEKKINELAKDKQALMIERYEVENDAQRVEELDKKIEDLEKDRDALKKELQNLFSEDSEFSAKERELMKYASSSDYESTEEFGKKLPPHLKEYLHMQRSIKSHRNNNLKDVEIGKNYGLGVKKFAPAATGELQQTPENYLNFLKAPELETNTKMFNEISGIQKLYIPAENAPNFYTLEQKDGTTVTVNSENGAETPFIHSN